MSDKKKMLNAYKKQLKKIENDKKHIDKMITFFNDNIDNALKYQRENILFLEKCNNELAKYNEQKRKALNDSIFIKNNIDELNFL